MNENCFMFQIMQIVDVNGLSEVMEFGLKCMQIYIKDFGTQHLIQEKSTLEVLNEAITMSKWQDKEIRILSIIAETQITQIFIDTGVPLNNIIDEAKPDTRENILQTINRLLKQEKIYQTIDDTHHGTMENSYINTSKNN